MSAMISRRGFLLGLAAAIAAPAVIRVADLMPVRALVPVIPTIPTLWGDGATDDTAALQALFDGEPYFDNRLGRVVQSPLPHLRSGTYRMSSTLHITRNDTQIKDVHFKPDWQKIGDGNPMLSILSPPPRFDMHRVMVGELPRPGLLWT